MTRHHRPHLVLAGACQAALLGLLPAVSAQAALGDTVSVALWAPEGIEIDPTPFSLVQAAPLPSGIVKWTGVRFSDLLWKFCITVGLSMVTCSPFFTGALLTAAQVQRDGMPLTGWIANHIDPDMHAQSENIETLKALMPCPLLGVVRWCGGDREDPEFEAAQDSCFKIT